MYFVMTPYEVRVLCLYRFRYKEKLSWGCEEQRRASSCCTISPITVSWWATFTYLLECVKRKKNMYIRGEVVKPVGLPLEKPLRLETVVERRFTVHGDWRFGLERFRPRPGGRSGGRPFVSGPTSQKLQRI